LLRKKPRGSAGKWTDAQKTSEPGTKRGPWIKITKNRRGRLGKKNHLSVDGWGKKKTKHKKLFPSGFSKETLVREREKKNEGGGGSTA